MRLPWVRRAPLEAQLSRLEQAHAHQLAEGRAVNRRLQEDADQSRRVASEAQVVAVKFEERAMIADGVANRLVQELALERERYAKLVDQVVDLKRDGYVMPVDVPLVPATPVLPIPPEVMRSVVKVSDPNTRERRAMETAVRDLLAAGMPHKEIAERVLQGQEIDV